MKMRRFLVDGGASSPVQAGMAKSKATLLLSIFSFALMMTAFVAALALVPARAYGEEQSSPSQAAPSQASQSQASPSQQEPAEPKKQGGQSHPSIAGELVKETREAAGEDEEENAKLKHGAPVQWLARQIGWSVHGTHLLLSGLNFAIIAVIVIWAGRKFLPGIFRNRNASIQQALQEARAASQDANRRLADIENRLRQLDVEIGQMQSTADREAAAEEGRIKRAAEEDVRKVILAAEQEIAAAGKQARRELSAHTAGLAIALARQEINVDSNTDQVLVRTFASGLATHPSSGSSNGDDKGGGKDGR
ncbi:MAG: ATP synthase F0 subunit B [Terriglobales bacterium]